MPVSRSVPTTTPQSGLCPATATFRAFDATASEAGCRTSGRGRTAGQGTATYDAASHTLQYHVQLTAAVPNTDYLLDISECDASGARTARGDGGHLHTNASGAASLDGTWPVQTGARWLRASVLAYCADPTSPAPTVPCKPEGYATEAMLPPGR